jgi:type IV pilus assembly protein PilO
MRFSLRNLRQRDIALILVVLTIVGGVLWYFYMYQPSQDRIAALEADIQRLDVDIRRGEDARRNLPELRLAVALLEEERRVFLSQLPRASQVSNVIDDLRLSAERAGVTISSFSQGTASANVESVRPLGFTVASNGNFGDTMAFLEVLEGLQRYTKVNQVGLSLTSDESDDPDLSSNIGFTVYVFTGTDPGER